MRGWLGARARGGKQEVFSSGSALGAVLQVWRCRCSAQQRRREASALEEVSAGSPRRPGNASPGARASGWAPLEERVF